MRKTTIDQSSAINETILCAKAMPHLVRVDSENGFPAILWGYDEFGPLLSNMQWNYVEEKGFWLYSGKLNPNNIRLQCRSRAKWHVANINGGFDRMFFFKEVEDAVLCKLRFGGAYGTF